MNAELIFAALGTVATLIAGAWVLLMLAGRQWEKRQELQFTGLNRSIAEIQARMDRYYTDMARLELKLSESEKNALLNFALKRDVEVVQRDILVEVKELTKHVNEWSKTIAGYMDRATDRQQHRS